MKKPKTWNELNKEIVRSSELQEGDYIVPHEFDLSQTRAKWKDKNYTSNLSESFYKVLKVNPKSIRIIDLVKRDIATVDKLKWIEYEYPILEKEIKFYRILDKDEIDKQVNSMK